MLLSLSHEMVPNRSFWEKEKYPIHPTMMKRLFLLSIGIGLYYHALGKPGTPTLRDAEFIIEKKIRHLLPEASRLFESAPAAPRSTEPEEPLTYHLLAIPPALNLLPHKIKVLRAKQEAIPQLYSHYLQGGGGNFYTPYIAYRWANRRSPYHAYGIHVKHLSLGDKTPFEETHNLVQLHGKKYFKTYQIRGDVRYSRDSYPLYTTSNSERATVWQQLSSRWRFPSL
mgnify:CR=1 FL=1